MESRLLRNKYFLYVTEFFFRYVCYGCRIGGEQADGALFQFLPDCMDRDHRSDHDRHGNWKCMGRALCGQAP